MTTTKQKCLPQPGFLRRELRRLANACFDAGRCSVWTVHEHRVSMLRKRAAEGARKLFLEVTGEELTERDLEVVFDETRWSHETHRAKLRADATTRRAKSTCRKESA